MEIIIDIRRFTAVAKNEISKKVLLTAITLICPIVYNSIGYTVESDVITHLLYSFLHVNTCHLLCNLIALWTVRNRMNILSAYCIAVIASYCPMHVTCPTLGMSSLLFAMFGIMWGKRGPIQSALKTGVPTILLTMILPQVNGLLHLYCYLLGIVYGKMGRWISEKPSI